MYPSSSYYPRVNSKIDIMIIYVRELKKGLKDSKKKKEQQVLGDRVNGKNTTSS
ncbi:unnamed protein product [marine sediment metagenome]|uniref:Uncharacterized protein n=1 Tax=marine sediment metagenome TaxID=412755 RepID=X1V7Z8_9ZZZZ